MFGVVEQTPLARGARTRLSGVNSASWVLLACAGLAAAANWWSRWADHRPTELWSKPLTLIGLIGVAVALDPQDASVRSWFVGALVLCLAGDVFLLGGERWFIAGLAAFLAGHVAYVVGFAVGEHWRAWSAAIAAIVIAAFALSIGRRIVAGVDRGAMRWAVTAYLGVISVMLVVAAGAGNGWAIAGASLFVVSDSVLGWRQFVASRPWMPVTVMVTYHLAQAALVLSLR